MRPINPFAIPSPVLPSPLNEGKDTPLPVKHETTAPKPSAAAFQPGAKARSKALVSTVRKQAQAHGHDDAKQEDSIAMAATAALFNPCFAALGLSLKDDIVVGYGGLTLGQERASFPGICRGFSDPRAMQESAEHFLHQNLRPSMVAGF